MSQDDRPDDAALLAMTSDQLVALEDVLADTFDEAFRHAEQERATTGRVSDALSEQLIQTQAMHTEVVEALQLKRNEDENAGHA